MLTMKKYWNENSIYQQVCHVNEKYYGWDIMLELKL